MIQDKQLKLFLQNPAKWIRKRRKRFVKAFPLPGFELFVIDREAWYILRKAQLQEINIVSSNTKETKYVEATVNILRKWLQNHGDRIYLRGGTAKNQYFVFSDALERNGFERDDLLFLCKHGYLTLDGRATIIEKYIIHFEW